MEKLSMCRVCLGEDIRLVPIVGTHLQEIYESLVLLPFDTEDGRPILVCYICRARLKNCYELKKSCLRSEELFTQMLSCNELEQVKIPGIYNEKRFYVKNVIHLSVVHVLGMDSDNVGVEALKCEVKDEPNDSEVISEDVLERNSVSDDVLLASSDSKNEGSIYNVGVETLFMSCDVKDEQSDPGDVDEDFLEESRVSDCVPSADSHDDFVTTVKKEQFGNRTSDFTPKEPTQDVQRSSEDSTSGNLNKHVLVQDTFKKHNKDIPNDKKERPASVQYTCDTCQQCYSSKCELQGHVRLCSVWKKDQSCGNTKSAQTHTAQKPNQCDVCNKRFSRIYNLTRHRILHTNDMPYECHVCKKKFAQKNGLTSHMRKHTGEKPYHCNVCKKQFSLKCSLTKHMPKHTGEKSYHCGICKKQFLLKGFLIVHMRTHTGEKPHHCDICKKRFSQKHYLTIHRRKHTGDKLYHCDICKKQFFEKGSLNRHMRTHTGEKSHRCYLCKKQFSRKSHLIGHMRIHTGEKPHHCNICKKQFSLQQNLRRHMSTHSGLSHII